MGTNIITTLLFVGILLVGLLIVIPFLFGAVIISERQVGIVIKRFARRNLPPGRLVALDGEAG